MVDELGLVSLIDSLIIQDRQQRQVSVGQCVKAMILNGLGFVNRTLYLIPHYFKDKPVERLLGEGIQAEHLNDDALGRALDNIYAYGPSDLYGQLEFQSVKRLGLSCRVGHLDSTSFHVDGVYNSRQDEVEAGVIHITQGYSRDHRPDLNQVVLHQETFPSQSGAATAKPTARWIFQFFAGIHLLLINNAQGIVLNCNDSHLQLLNLLGKRYCRIYSNSG